MKKDKTVLSLSRSLLMDIICMCVYILYMYCIIYRQKSILPSFENINGHRNKKTAPIFDLILLKQKQKENPFPASLTYSESGIVSLILVRDLLSKSIQ